MTHDEDVRLVRDRMCQMCTGEDETAYSENCRRPKGAHDCWLQDALDRILARYDALVAEHEAYRPHRFTAYVSDEHDAAYDNVERVMKP
jgi:hypothetical protein